MKRRNKWKPAAAALLSSAMLFSNIGMVSMADQAVSGGKWVLKDGHRYYVTSAGEAVANDIYTIDGKKYAFGEGGILIKPERNNPVASGKFCDFKGETYFIGYNGVVEGDKETSRWFFAEGEDGGADWYFYNNADKGYLKDTYKVIDKKLYKFDEKGIMISSVLDKYQTDNSINMQTIYFTCAANGDAAEKKWIHVDGSWYYFGDEKNLIEGKALAAVTGNPKDGQLKEYSFDDDGKLITGNVPYGEVSSVSLGKDKDSLTIQTGVKYKLPISFITEANDEEVPAAANLMQLEDNEKEKEEVKDPEDKAEVPQDEVEVPKDEIEIPKDEVENPKDETEIPSDEVDVPKDETENPEGEAEVPKDEVEVPKDETENPKGEAEIPKDEVENPKDETENPKGEAEIPKNEVEKPNDVTEEPEDEKEVSKNETESPKNEADTSKDEVEKSNNEMETQKDKTDAFQDEDTPDTPFVQAAVNKEKNTFVLFSLDDKERDVFSSSANLDDDDESQDESTVTYSGSEVYDVLQKAYDFGFYTESTGDVYYRFSSKVNSDGTITIESDIPGTAVVYSEIDGVRSNSIEITFEMKENTANAAKTLDGLTEQSPQAAVKQIKEMSTDILMNTIKEKDAADKYRQIEENYMFESNIGKEVTVEQELTERFKSEKLHIIGAALNAEAGNNILFAMSNPEGDTDLSSINKTTKVPIDLSLLIDGEVKSDLDVPVLITVPIPNNLSLSGLELYHVHNGQIEKMEISVNSSERTAAFATSQLSTFVFAVDSANSNNGGSGSGGSGGGGGGSSSSGSPKTSDYAGEQGAWIQDETGWWFKKVDGSYPVDAWIMTGNEWYRFDDKGYMLCGWFTDKDGKKYYLSLTEDGTKGIMKTGWQFIDGKWYYFNSNSDGTKGALLVSTMTPDGHAVDADGAWTP